jgi:hypothetical protein
LKSEAGVYKFDVEKPGSNLFLNGKLKKRIENAQEYVIKNTRTELGW